MTRSTVLVFLLFIFCVFAAGTTQKALDRYRTPEAALEESLYLPNGKILRVVSLGFNSLVADILWIKSVLYFGKHTIDDDNPYTKTLMNKHGRQSHHGSIHQIHSDNKNPIKNQTRKDRHQNRDTDRNTFNLTKYSQLNKNLYDFKSKDLAPYIYPLLRRVTRLNPHFIYPYKFGGLVALNETGEIDEAYSLLKYGLKHNPNHWEIPYYLGYIDLLYRRNNEKALQWLGQAVVLPNHPPFLDRLYKSLTKRINAEDTVLAYLKSFYSSTDDETIREQITKMIQKISSDSN